MLGQTLNGRYAILGQLGEGGMGSVYEARHLGTGRRVAVKVMAGALAREPSVAARFQVEAKAAGGIESQYVAQVLDVDSDAETGAPYMVMEYLSGEDLQHLIERLGPLPPELALRVTAQACLGLEKAHAAGIIHRDIKPANIFLSERDGGEIVVKLLDFGVAKLTEGEAGQSSVTRTGSLVGSPLYMSPEQARGAKAIDHRTDLWSLGVVLFQALTGRAPHDDVDGVGDLIIAICSAPAAPVQDAAPWVAAEVAAVARTALALKPDDRYADATAMSAALRVLLPRGVAIDPSMVAPLTAEARETVAPRDGAVAAPASPEPRADLPSAPTVPFPTRPAGTPRDVAGAPVERPPRKSDRPGEGLPNAPTDPFPQGLDGMAMLQATSAALPPRAIVSHRDLARPVVGGAGAPGTLAAAATSAPIEAPISAGARSAAISGAAAPRGRAATPILVVAALLLAGGAAFLALRARGGGDAPRAPATAGITADSAAATPTGAPPGPPGGSPAIPATTADPTPAPARGPSGSATAGAGVPSGAATALPATASAAPATAGATTPAVPTGSALAIAPGRPGGGPPPGPRGPRLPATPTADPFGGTRK